MTKKSNSVSQLICVPDGWFIFVFILVFLFGMMPQRADGWPNILKDPGFEKYQLDIRGFYRLRSDSPWVEVSMGKGSVQLDMNGWKAPDRGHGGAATRPPLVIRPILVAPPGGRPRSRAQTIDGSAATTSVNWRASA